MGNLAEKNESERSKSLKPARPSIGQKFKIGFCIFHNSEFWGNKVDGLKMNHMRCHLINCRIRQNNISAIFMEGKHTEKHVKIYCSSTKTNDIKGKIHGDTGLLYPRIMIREDTEDITDELRKHFLQVLTSHFESKYTQGQNSSNSSSIRSCFGFGGNGNTAATTAQMQTVTGGSKKGSGLNLDTNDYYA